MRVLHQVLREIVGLFADDWATTVALAVCVLLAAVALPHISVGARGFALFGGVTLVLVVSVGAGARRATPTRS